jgi:hypothetical protein
MRRVRKRLRIKELLMLHQPIMVAGLRHLPT